MCNCLQCNCVVWDDDERKGEGETRCRLIACSSRKAPRGSPGLTPSSDGQIAINGTICLLNIQYILRKGLEFNPGLWCTVAKTKGGRSIQPMHSGSDNLAGKTQFIHPHKNSCFYVYNINKYLYINILKYKKVVTRYSSMERPEMRLT